MKSEQLLINRRMKFEQQLATENEIDEQGIRTTANREWISNNNSYNNTCGLLINREWS